MIDGSGCSVNPISRILFPQTRILNRDEALCCDPPPVAAENTYRMGGGYECSGESSSNQVLIDVSHVLPWPDR